MSQENTILDWIRQRLGDPGKTQAGLAEALGVDRAQITRLLQGRRELKLREIRLISTYFGAEPPAAAGKAPGAPAGASVMEAIEAIARGEMVVVTDDDDRENEGDLVMAASLCTPEKMAFIIRNCCGIVCAPLTGDEARRLHLAPMVASNDAPLGTAFTVSVDARHGLTTGISAEQRANTVRALANGNMGASDFVRPGHVFPLIAREGGVLMRSGHTEAAVDLCRLAGLPPVGVICELANDDGTVMAGAQIDDFARKHALKRISVADLIAYRQAREKLVERVAVKQVKTFAGDMALYVYTTPFDPVQHFALVHGNIGDGLNVPARLHRADILGDVFGASDTLRQTLERFKREGRGVLVYMRDGTAGVPANVVGAGDEDSEQKRTKHWLDVGLGAQILKDIGVRSIRLRTSTPMTYVGLSGFGIEIAGVEGV
ncbi:MAG: 3,4-dihydroxy-2-butanone-4-phosphate synthase [Hyphomicrobiales bacterium]|nr:3,4-dihydroxy-2-butanone-4-phosphate synthase [Hyphomicrobiales bacterium]